MNKVIKIDIKEGMPTVDVALFHLQNEIKLGKLSGVKVIKVIHGYGSHGRGGTIKIETRLKLKELKRKGIIKDFIPGEGWSVNKVKPMGLLKDAPELLLNKDGESFNSGVTIILL